MPVQLFKAKLAERTQLTETFLFLQFELLEPNSIEFTAGQYILLNVPSDTRKRQYSIVSAPRLTHAIELLVELIPNGHASVYFSAMKPGEEITFYAPAGEFTIKQEVLDGPGPLAFVATGSGLAPLRSMILDLLRSKETKRPLTLYWGMRHATDLFWLDYFEELKKNYPNFSYHITLSAPPEGWTLCNGRVTNCLSTHEIPMDAHYYVCGNPHMIEDVMKVLGERGIPETQIHHEKFS